VRVPAAIVLALAIAVPVARAAEGPQWPPPPDVLGHMRDLQSKIADPASSKEERAAARSELEKLMKSPAGQQRPTQEKRPARAAIDPFPSVVKPIEAKPLSPPPPTARVEVIPDPPPRRPTVNPATGSVVQPSAPGTAVDPRTGHVLHETPAGYVDPLTGRFIPK
jgi:hypothetical protein